MHHLLTLGGKLKPLAVTYNLTQELGAPTDHMSGCMQGIFNRQVKFGPKMTFHAPAHLDPYTNNEPLYPRDEIANRRT